MAVKYKQNTYSSNAPAYNEHQKYIQDTYSGGYDSYIKNQQDRYDKAYVAGDKDLMGKLDQDALRVGYQLTVPTSKTKASNRNADYGNSYSVMPNYSQQIDDLLNATQAYQVKTPDISYPDMPNYNFDNIKSQMSDLISQLQSYQGANYMSMDEAMARANSQLGGLYNQSLDSTLEQYNKNAIQRGMFGQVPVEALKQQAIAENELNKSSAINSLATNLYSQDFNMAQQKDQDYYNQINNLANLLGQQYNSELGEYQSDINQYNTIYNQSRQASQDYFDNIYRYLDILGAQQDMQNSEMDRYVSNIGQFSNDYQAEINRITNDNDPSNDWQIAYLQNARNQKIAGQNSAQANAQNETYNQAMDMFAKLGYASGWVAEALGLPEGTKTASYSNQLASRSSGSGSSEAKQQNITIPQRLDMWQQAVNMLTKEEPVIDSLTGRVTGYNKVSPSYDEVNALYLQLIGSLGYDPYDLMLLEELSGNQSQNNQQSKAYTNPILDSIRSTMGAKFWGY